ncbi:MAG: hypothetical protein D3910_04375 [Candidatus Electrothrix sp. ATG2]|nr:hypothetical protein [Candidatus Electrothrix sp. ATG2]
MLTFADVKMKKLPEVTLFIWGIFVLGYCFHPELLQQDAVQFPLALLFSVLLPVSFWQVANAKKNKYLGLFFVGIFIVNISFLLVNIRGSFVMQQQISEELNRGIPEELAEYLVTAVSGNKRRIAAQLIYHQYGVALPFKNKENSYTLYAPSQADKKTFQKHFFTRNELKITKGGLSSSFFTLILLLMIHAGLFIGLLAFLVLYDQRMLGESS